MVFARQPLRWFCLWFVLGWLLVLWVVYQSLTPSPVQAPSVLYGDKLGHFSAYFLMMAWFAQLYARPRYLLLLIFFILLGVVIEILQSQTSYRLFEFADMIANSLGVVTAWFLAKQYFYFSKILYRCERVLLN